VLTFVENVIFHCILSCIMQALSGKHQDIVRTLLAAEECDVTTRDTSGTSAQELASQMGVSLEVATSTLSSDEMGTTTTTTKVGMMTSAGQEAALGDGGKKTRRRVKELERELEEQRNLVAGLRDMLNMVRVPKMLFSSLPSNIYTIDTSSQSYIYYCFMNPLSTFFLEHRCC